MVDRGLIKFKIFVSRFYNQTVQLIFYLRLMLPTSLQIFYGTCEKKFGYKTKLPSIGLHMNTG